VTTTKAQGKVSALLQLAAGKSQRVAAEAAGVSAATVSTWCKQPLFAEELAALTALYGRKPLDGTALMDRLTEAEERLAPAPSASSGTRHVQVRVPAGTPESAVRRRVGRAVVRSLSREVAALKEAGGPG